MAIKSARNKLAGTPGDNSRSDGAELPALIGAAPARPSDDVDAAFDGSGTSMSITEWQERFRLMLLAGAFRDE
jgi:hypothetical protein